MERNSDNMLLRLSGVTSGYGRVKIVNGVSLTVDKGEILAVIGRNGVGKTTLMKTLIGSIRVMHGQIELDGQDVTLLPPAKRARLGIGYVPQGRGIFARMSVAANLSLGAGIGNLSTLNYDRVFEFFPILKERMNQPAGSMSGGQQQQLAIGRILAGHPKVILLDEPSEGIQPNIVQQIGHIIRQLKEQEKLTVVLVEQNLNLIQAVADRCAVIDKGIVVAHLRPEDLADRDVARRYLAV